MRGLHHAALSAVPSLPWLLQRRARLPPDRPDSRVRDGQLDCSACRDLDREHRRLWQGRGSQALVHGSAERAPCRSALGCEIGGGQTERPGGEQEVQGASQLQDQVQGEKLGVLRSRSGPKRRSDPLAVANCGGVVDSTALAETGRLAVLFRCRNRSGADAATGVRAPLATDRGSAELGAQAHETVALLARSHDTLPAVPWIGCRDSWASFR